LKEDDYHRLVHLQALDRRKNTNRSSISLFETVE
jgi:hypothetical protein